LPRSSGNYTAPPGQPVVTDTSISSSVFNALVADVGAEITNSVPRDGSAPPTANMPMGGYRMTGMADGVSAQDSATVAQVALKADLTALAAPTGAGLIGKTGGGTVQDSINSARSISTGGTGATTKSDALTNLGILDLTQELSVSASGLLATSALGRSVAVTASAVVNAELPTASVGAYINIRVTRASTNYVVVFKTGVNIDGATYRIMLPGESVLLMFNGSEWVKISGVSKPVRGGAQRTASQSILANAYTQIIFTSTFGDSSFSNFLYNSGSGNLLCKRAGIYQISATAGILGTGVTGSDFQIAIVKNAGVPTLAPNVLSLSSIDAAKTRVVGNVSGIFELVDGDIIGVVVYVTTGTGIVVEYNSPSIAPTISVTEIPSW